MTIIQTRKISPTIQNANVASHWLQILFCSSHASVSRDTPVTLALVT